MSVDEIRKLRTAGRHEEARERAVALVIESRVGMEADRVPCNVAAIGGYRRTDQLRQT